MNRFACCLVLFAVPCLLQAQSDDTASAVWSGSWEDPLLEKRIHSSGEVGSGPNGERTVSLYGGGWHEGGHDCAVTLVDDSTGWSEHCPVFDEYQGGTTRVGIRNVAGEKLLVHLGEGEQWLNWVGPEPAWRMGQSWPLFDLWRALAGEWEPVGDPLAPRLQVSGQRCEAKWSKGWSSLNMVFEEMDIPVRDAVHFDGEGTYRVALQGDQLTLTKLEDVGAEYNVVMWEATEEVTEFRRLSSLVLAPFEGLPGVHPELSLSTVNRKHLDQSPEALRLMRNEIFARHGWRFQSEDLRAHFDAQSWYVPRDSNEGVTLNAVETFNVNRLRERENRLRLESRLPVVFGPEWRGLGERGLQRAEFGGDLRNHTVLLRQSTGGCHVVSAPLGFRLVDEDLDVYEVSAVGHPGEVIATFPGMALPEGEVPCGLEASRLEVGQAATLGSDRFTVEGAAPSDVPAQEGAALRFLRLDAAGSPDGGHAEPVPTQGLIYIEWSGDLNGDGRTDVVLSYKPKYSYTLFELWMTDPMTGALKRIRRSDRVFAC